MTGVVVLLIWLIVTLVILLVLCARRIEMLYKRNMDQTVERLQGVISEEAESLWTLVRAQVLRDAAADWPKVDAIAERKRLSWVPHAPDEAMVVRWLQARAERLEKGLSASGNDED